MLRNLGIITLGLAAIANLNAGQVAIGSGLNGVNGLTNGTVTATTTATQSSGGKYGEQTYANGGILQATTPASFAAITSGNSLTADGVTFQMINDSGSYAADNMWAGTNDTAGASGNPSTVTNTFTIPMAVFGVTNVYTMLNDEFAAKGTAADPNGTNTTVQIIGSMGTETFSLVNGTVIRDSFDCTGGTNTLCKQGGTDGLQSILDTTNSYSTSGSIVTPASNVASVTAFNVWNGAYSADTYGPYNGTSGTINLDAQNFYLGAFAGEEVTSIVITDTQTGAYQSRDELTAITLATSTSAPEPSTVVLLLAGLGAVAYVGRRKAAATRA